MGTGVSRGGIDFEQVKQNSERQRFDYYFRRRFWRFRNSRTAGPMLGLRKVCNLC